MTKALLVRGDTNLDVEEQQLHAAKPEQFIKAGTTGQQNSFFLHHIEFHNSGRRQSVNL